MLNATLKEHISCYLGNHEIISPRLTALFNCISDWYNEMENSQARSLKSQLEIAFLLSRLSNQFEQLHQNKNLTPAAETGHQNLFHDHGDDSQEELLNRLEIQIKEFKDSSTATSGRISELEKINKDLDQFAYTVSHDLKSPLRSIANLAQWIEDDLAGVVNEQAKENFNLLRNRIFRMEELINAILIYSKSSKTGSEIQLTDTGNLIREVIDSINCPGNISIRVKGKFPVFHTESIKLQQVFSNLISNSIKFMDKETGIIEAGFFDMEDQCQFYIQDNGPGMEGDFQNKAFMLFQSLNTHHDFECSGVGLAIVKRIIDEAGGKVWIESEKGKGAKFVFTWPKLKHDKKNTSHV